MILVIFPYEAIPTSWTSYLPTNTFIKIAQISSPSIRIIHQSPFSPQARFLFQNSSSKKAYTEAQLNVTLN